MEFSIPANPFRTPGGVHAPHRKHTANSQSVEMPAPGMVVIPMSMHIGAHCTPTVKVGEEIRTVVSGIALAYTPEQMVGKKLAMITNLKPAKLCGIVSEGMIICAEDENGNLSLIVPEKDVPSGTTLG